MINFRNNGENNRVFVHENYNICGFDLAVEGNDNVVIFSRPLHVAPYNSYQISVFGSHNVLRIGAIYGNRVSIHCVNDFHCSIGDRTSIQKVFISSNEASEVSIGEDCLIADEVKIYPTDFHKILANGERINPPQPITIGNKVWLGESSTILKGVNIEEGCVIGAGSVVTGSVPIPKGALVAGNPARILRLGIEWEP